MGGQNLDERIDDVGVELGAAAADQFQNCLSRGHRLPMRAWYRLGREDAAEVIVHALREPRARNATLDVVWKRGEPTRDWTSLFRDAVPDPPPEKSSA